jgi:hemoglobin/transferrin/lactoferrin receptor protein
MVWPAPRGVWLLGALLALPHSLPAQARDRSDGELTSASTEALPLVEVKADTQADPQEFATAKVSRTSAQQMNLQQVRNLKDLARYEPGVSVTNNPSRFGLAGFNIRGVNDNRILMQVDGVRMPDTFVMGGYSNAPRDMVDIELLEAIDIMRGTGSALLGSDALGGAVAYSTPRPEDILDGRSRAMVLKGMYQSVDQSRAVIATGAAQAGVFKLMARKVWRQAQESETQGDVGGTGIRRTMANPQQQDSDAALFKVAYVPSASYRAELGYQSSDRRVDTQVLSQVVGGLAKDMNARDGYHHEQWTLDQRFSGGPVGQAELKLYHQRARTAQDTRQDRNNPSNAPTGVLLYERHFEFEQETLGLKMDVTSQFKAAGSHQLKWGGEWSQTSTLQLRDGYTTLQNGSVERAVTVDTFPTRDTPPADTRRWALYAQDEWFVTDDVMLVAGARYEQHRLTPKPDAIYLANDAAAPARGATVDNLAPKLGAVWSLGGGYSLAGQYAHGFRAPPYDDVNIGFANLQAGYTAVANAALAPETSRGVDLVLRHADERGRWSVTLFDTRYRNFIENQQLDCPTDPACSTQVPLTFQARNVPSVRIYGLEAQWLHELRPGWAVHGSLAWARGRRTLTDEPLDTVNPASGALGVVHQRGPWRYELSTSFAAGQRDEDAEHHADTGQLKRQFLPTGYAVADLRVNWQFAKRSHLSLGVFNLFDQLYHQWADIPVADIHIPDSQAGRDRYSSPGRNVAITLSIDH